MKKQEIEVPSPRFLYYIIAINGKKSVSNRMVLVDHFDRNQHRIDKYHYLKGVKSILSVGLSISEKEVERYLKDLISKYTNDVSVIDNFVGENTKSKRKKKEYKILNVKRPRIAKKITDFFSKVNNDEKDPFEDN